MHSRELTVITLPLRKPSTLFGQKATQIPQPLHHSLLMVSFFFTALLAKSLAPFGWILFSVAILHV
jgi:hypothetical protein